MSAESIIITGGAGFIGSHLCERFLADGCAVTVIDDCSTGTFRNLETFAAHPRLAVLQGKVSELPGLTDLAAKADLLVHLAAAVGVELVVHSPIRTIETNLQETEAALKACSQSKTPILLASTSEVYGKSSKEAFSESDDLIIGPPHLGRWSYACSKLMDEFLAMAYFREKGTPVTVARLFNTVGPRQTGQFGMALPRFIGAALRNEPLRVFGTGEQTRCFCYVADTVEALTRLAFNPGARGEVFNIGSSEEISILNLARKVIALLGSRSTVELVPYDQAYSAGFQDMLRRKPVLEKLARVTGFTPSTSLDEIILKTAAWMA
jgi:UDP-glucose 4-epimerase